MTFIVNCTKMFYDFSFWNVQYLSNFKLQFFAIYSFDCRRHIILYLFKASDIFEFWKVM